MSREVSVKRESTVANLLDVDTPIAWQLRRYLLALHFEVEREDWVGVGSNCTMGWGHYRFHMSFPRYLKPLLQSEAKCKTIYMKIFFTLMQIKLKKGFALTLVLKVRVFGTRKWSIGFHKVYSTVIYCHFFGNTHKIEKLRKKKDKARKPKKANKAYE